MLDDESRKQAEGLAALFDERFKWSEDGLEALAKVVALFAPALAQLEQRIAALERGNTDGRSQEGGGEAPGGSDQAGRVQGPAGEREVGTGRPGPTAGAGVDPEAGAMGSGSGATDDNRAVAT